jgi:nucleotide-binding universal stress UspA family protein
MNTILLPTDFSDNSLKAIEFAAMLAKQNQSRLLLFHAFSEYTSFSMSPYSVEQDIPKEDMTEEALQKIAANLVSVHGESVPVNYRSRPGEAVEEIEKIAAEENVSLIVMGTKGTSDTVDSLMGSNTSSLVRKVKCPVLAVPANARFKGLRKVVFASGFENDDTVPLQILQQLLQGFTPEITILNIRSRFEPEFGEREAQALERLKSALPGSNLVFVQQTNDDVEDAIQAYCREYQADLLVLPLHKKGWLEKLLEVSISKELVEEANLPMLTIPA